MVEYEHKFKVYRLSDVNQIEPTLNSFDLGGVEDVHIAMPDYRVIILIVRYVIDVVLPDPKPEAKNDKAAK